MNLYSDLNLTSVSYSLIFSSSQRLPRVLKIHDLPLTQGNSFAQGIGRV